MAEHADSIDRELADDTGCQPDNIDSAGAQRRFRRGNSAPWIAVAVCAAAMVALGCVGGWMWYRIDQGRQAQTLSDQLVDAARQGALNLTTVDHATVDADIQRILDSSTGAFHDDFQKRSKPFIDAAKQAQSTSTGTVVEAGLQSQHGNEAKVLVAVSVAMSAPGQPDDSPTSWRMEIMVETVGESIKMSDVQFVA